MGQIPSVLKIALSKNIFNFCKKVTGFKNLHITDNALFFNSKFVKRLQYDWHQEKVYFPNTTKILSLWYPWLHPVNENNGTMIMAEGSHEQIFKYQKKNSKMV
jgi:hypothetical protein